MVVVVVVVVGFCGVFESRIRPDDDDDDDDDDERRSNAPRCCVEGVTVFPFPFEDFFV